MTDTGMAVIEKAPKTASGRRTLPLPSQVTAALKACKATQAGEQLAAGPAYAASGYVLVDELGDRNAPIDYAGRRTRRWRPQVFAGPSFFIIGPQGRANTEAPAISYSPGHTIVQYDLSQSPPVVTSFSPTAPVTDICGLLA